MSIMEYATIGFKLVLLVNLALTVILLAGIALYLYKAKEAPAKRKKIYSNSCPVCCSLKTIFGEIKIVRGGVRERVQAKQCLNCGVTVFGGHDGNMP